MELNYKGFTVQTGLHVLYDENSKETFNYFSKLNVICQDKNNLNSLMLVSHLVYLMSYIFSTHSTK